jgi:AcrR family transcriptional regulator
MEDIAAAAGVGKATLYRYFGDKEGLYLALLARSSDQFMARMECVARGPGGPRRRLEQLADAIISFFDDTPHLLDLIQRSEVLSKDSGSFPWQETREKLPRLFKRLFAEAAAVGEFQVRDPDLNVLMLMGGLRAIIRFGERPRPPDLGRAVVADFLAGVAHPAKHEPAV